MAQLTSILEALMEGRRREERMRGGEGRGVEWREGRGWEGKGGRVRGQEGEELLYSSSLTP